jgi:hypothetical protein
MTVVPARLRRILVGMALGLAPAVRMAAGAECPTSITFEPTGTATVDAGWNGLAHGLAVAGGTLQLAVTCSSTTPPCGACVVAGIASSPNQPLRCIDDTSRVCSPATEVADCGTVGTCHTLLGPPQSVGVGGLALCYVAGLDPESVGGTFEPDSGALTATIQIRADVYGGLFVASCPRCLDDPTPNDGAAGGTCDSGPRSGLACDANAVSIYTDFGATSFDCPPPPAIRAGSAKSDVSVSTGTQTMTLTASSLPCPGTGKKCFCGTCNTPHGGPCTRNADCPPNGTTPGICNGTRCLGGTNAGAPCSAASECPGNGSLGCGIPGDGPRPNACVDDTATAGPSCQDLGTGHGECVNGPVSKACAGHPNRSCATDDDCDGAPGTCLAFNRRCFLDLGVIGGTESVAGATTPPIAGIADPVTLGALGCAAATDSPFVNVVFGLPGLVRTVQTGRVVSSDAGPGPSPSPSPVPTPRACREPIIAAKAIMQVRRDTLGAKAALAWSWRKGAATTLAELGSPTTVDAYDLSLYDASGFRAGFAVPAAGTCDGKPCWRRTATGFSYRNKAGIPAGVTQLDLRAGADGKAQIRFGGRGPLLALPDLATLAPPLRLELRRRASGPCWGATFSAPFQKLTATTLRDRAD